MRCIIFFKNKVFSGPSTQRIRQSVLPYSLSLASSVTSSSNSSSNGSWKGTPRRNNADRLMSSSLNASVTGDEMFFQDEELSRCMDALSAADAARMNKYSYLTLTATFEKYLGPGAFKLASDGSPSGGEKKWMNNFLRKIKHKDGKGAKEAEDLTVFGQPLEVIYRRTGHCLPRTILEVCLGCSTFLMFPF